MLSRYSEVRCGACKTTHDIYIQEPAYPYLTTRFVCPATQKSVRFVTPEKPTERVKIVPNGGVVASVDSEAVG